MKQRGNNRKKVIMRYKLPFANLTKAIVSRCLACPGVGLREEPKQRPSRISKPPSGNISDV